MEDQINNISIKEIIKQEYTHCLQDVSHFIKKYTYIQHPQRGRIIFNLFPFQEKVTKLFSNTDNRYIVVNKSRQLGVSTLVAAYALWLMLFNSDKNVLVIATKQDTAKNMITKVQFMYESLPRWLKLPTVENNKLSLKLSNGSQIKAVSAAGDSGRSEAVSLLIIDEAAFIEDIDEIFPSAQQTLSTGGQCIAISTPKGVGNWFHSTFVGAELNENGFLPIKLPWYVHPERDQKWRDEQDKILGKKMAAQECFSGDTIIYTKNGPRYISDIKIGDNILSHDGSYNKVTKVFDHVSENIFQIKSTLNHRVKYTTGNHPFLSQDGFKKFEEINNDWVKLFPKVKLTQNNSKIDLKNLIYSYSPRHFVKFNDNNIWITKKHISPRYIDFDYDLGYIIGLYYSEGSQWNNVTCYSYNAKTERNTWVLDLENKLRSKFGIEKFSHYLPKNNDGGNLYIKSKLFNQFIETCFEGEKYCQSKYISSFVYQNSSEECLKGILDGIMIGDGMMKKEYNSQIALSSERLIYDVLYINHLLGIHNISLRQSETTFPSGKKGSRFVLNLLMSKVNSDNKKYSERILERKVNTSKYKNAFLYDNNEPFIKLKGEKSNKKLIVYNFEVENTHTYVTEYGIVHNCDTDFSTSGDTVIDPEMLKFYKETFIKDPVEKRGITSDYWLWEYPDYSKSYMLIADVARGDDKDFSAFHVIEIEGFKQVAEFKSKISTRDFAKVIIGVATEWNSALVVIENSGVGWDVVSSLVESDYDNLYYSVKNVGDLTPDSYISKYDSGQTVPGFTNSTKTRPLVTSKLKESIHDKGFTFYSRRFLNELETFVWESGKAQALKGYNDDLCMAAAIGTYVRDVSLRFDQYNKDMSRAAVGNISRVRPYSSNEHIYPLKGGHNPYVQEIGDKKFDLRWLL